VLQRRFVRSQGFELVLGEIAGDQALAFAACAGGEPELVGEQLDQRRFARAIPAEQTHAFAWAQLQLQP
jgi:hypothetical protein